MKTNLLIIILLFGSLSCYFDHMSGYSSLIEQFSTTTLNKIKSFSVSPVPVIENGGSKLYESSAMYIFVNKEGSTLFALKNLKVNYSKDYWTMESFDLGNKGNGTVPGSIPHDRP